jgi:hypothetical protein
MHELFELVEILPVAPGESPFHVRGLYYIRLLEHARSLPGGQAAFFDALKDPRLPEFYRQKFAWSKWYDALPTIPAHTALARLRGLDFETLTRERGKLAGQRIVPAMFRAVLGLASVQAMAQHVPRMIMHNFDFFRQSTTHVHGNAGVGGMTAVPRILAPGVANIIIGFIEGVLELTGYRDVRADYTKVWKDGTNQGYEAVGIEYRFEWTPKK